MEPRRTNASVNSGEHASSRPTQHEDLASRLEILNGLLNALTDVLDIRDVAGCAASCRTT